MSIPEEPHHAHHSKKFFLGSLLFFLILSIFLIKSMLLSILGGALLAYIFHPLYKKLNRVIKSKSFSAFLMAIILLILVMVPVAFAGNAIINEAFAFFQRSKSIDYTNFENKVSDFLGKPVNVGDQLEKSIGGMSASMTQWASGFVLSLPAKALSAFILLSVMYYLFMGSESFMQKVRDEIPLKESIKDNLISRFHEVTFATVYGLILTALVQGALGAITFWIFDVPSPLLWGLVMVVMAMLPLVGTALVWGPAAIYKIFIGEYFDGFGILIVGLVVISSVDNVIRPKIIGERGKVHPGLAILGVFGGLEVFGLFGIILGPLIIAITSVLVEIYLTERRKANL